MFTSLIIITITAEAMFTVITMLIVIVYCDGNHDEFRKRELPWLPQYYKSVMVIKIMMNFIYPLVMAPGVYMLLSIVCNMFCGSNVNRYKLNIS